MSANVNPIDLPAVRAAALSLRDALLNLGDDKADHSAVHSEGARLKNEADARMMLVGPNNSRPAPVRPEELSPANVVCAFGDRLLSLLDPAGVELLPLSTRVALNNVGRLLNGGKWDYRPGAKRD